MEIPTSNHNAMELTESELTIDDLKRAVEEILDNCDPSNISLKQIRTQLSEKISPAVATRKDEIRAIVEDYLLRLHSSVEEATAEAEASAANGDQEEDEVVDDEENSNAGKKKLKVKKKAGFAAQIMYLAPELASFMGAKIVPRTTVAKELWKYIKEKNLQNPKDRREILCDETLEKIFKRKKLTIFSMNKYTAQLMKLARDITPSSLSDEDSDSDEEQEGSDDDDDEEEEPERRSSRKRKPVERYGAKPKKVKKSAQETKNKRKTTTTKKKVSSSLVTIPMVGEKDIKIRIARTIKKEEPKSESEVEDNNTDTKSKVKVVRNQPLYYCTNEHMRQMLQTDTPLPSAQWTKLLHDYCKKLPFVEGQKTAFICDENMRTLTGSETIPRTKIFGLVWQNIKKYQDDQNTSEKD